MKLGITRRKPYRGFAGDQAGSNAVEFSLIAPVLLLLAFGMFYTAHLIAVSHAMVQVVSQTALAAANGDDHPSREKIAHATAPVLAQSYFLITDRPLHVDVENGAGTMTVRLRYPMSDLPTFPIIGAVLPLPDFLHRSITVHVQDR